MKAFLRLLLLTIVPLSILAGCDNNSDHAPKAQDTATYDKAIYDKSTWK